MPVISQESISRLNRFGTLLTMSRLLERSLGFADINIKKNNILKFLTLKNHSNKLNNMKLSYLEFYNSILNYSHNKANHWSAKTLEYLSSIYFG